mgnify:FL=1|tara:strand:- start:794 stop:1195 length:402 start_codon:yes stop_codon:yes gene_type:complete
MGEDNLNKNPRIIVVQKLYAYFLNKESELTYPKHRYKKFIKDTVSGTIEREELLLENLKIILKDEFKPSRTDLILKIMIFSATFELMFSHKTPINVIVSEYVKISDFFLETAHKGYLNAILDKISKKVRKDSE